jgi:hypothetical protein
MADPDPTHRSAQPARAYAVAPIMPMPEVATAASGSAATAASGSAATASGSAATAASGSAATASGLCRRISRAYHQTRDTDGHEAIDSEQGGYCQTARQEFASSILSIPGHLITRLRAFRPSTFKRTSVQAPKQGVPAIDLRNDKADKVVPESAPPHHLHNLPPTFGSPRTVVIERNVIETQLHTRPEYL